MAVVVMVVVMLEEVLSVADSMNGNVSFNGDVNGGIISYAGESV